MRVRLDYRNVALLVVLVVATCVLYHPGLGGPLVFDDFSSVKPLLDAENDNLEWRARLMSASGPFGRPVSMLSFLANRVVSGTDLWWWKATNLALHCLVGILLFATASRLFQLAPLRTMASTTPALVVSALWLVHPGHVSTVLYTVQRMTILAALFTLAGILVYLHGRVTSPHPRGARWWIGSAFLVCLPLAVLSKENGLLLPAFLALLEFTLLRTAGRPADRRFVYGLFVVFLALPLVVMGIRFCINFESALMKSHLLRGFTVWERLLTEQRVVVAYLAETLLPSRPRFGFFHDDITLSTSLLSPPTTLLSGISLATFAGTALVLRRRLPCVSFGMLWFLVGHSLESTIIPLELMFEHRNYLPSFGLLMAAVGGLSATRLVQSKAATLVVGGLVVACALVARSIVLDWRSEPHFYAAAYSLHPRSPTAASQLAQLFTARGEYAAATAILHQVPGAGARVQRWYVVCRQTGKLNGDDFSTEIFEHERTVTTYAVTGLIEIAKLGLDGACDYSRENFLTLLQGALERPIVVSINRQKLLLYAAQFAAKTAAYAEAYRFLTLAAEQQPADPIPWLLTADWKAAQGDVDDAALALARAERLAGASGLDYSELVEATRARLARASRHASGGP